MLIDTSVWVDFFREEASPVQAVVSLLLEQGRAAVCGAVKMELLSTPKSPKDLSFEWLSRNVPSLDTLEADFEHAGHLRSSLIRSGHRAGLADILIAAVALRHRAEVYTLDKQFSRIPGLKLYQA